MKSWEEIFTGADRQLLEKAGMAQKQAFGSRPALLIIDVTAAVIAIDGIPRFDAHIGARAVVGAEDLANDDEEVQEPPLCERPANGGLAFAFTQAPGFHMRMHDFRVGRRRLGVGRPNRIGPRSADPPPVQLDRKRPQVDAIECDRLSRRLDHVMAKIELHLLEFSIEAHELVVNLA